MLKTTGRVALFLIFVPALLFSLREFASPGGDSVWISSLLTRPWFFFMRAPLVLTFHKGLWALLGAYGWSPADCVALSSSIAGGVFLAGLLRLSKDPRVWVVVLASRLCLVFVGHVEHYAWPYALALWAIVFLKEIDERTERPERPTRLLVLTLALAALCHPMTLMMWPGVVWALRPWSEEKLKPFLIGLVALAGITILLLLTGKPGGFIQGKWLLPLFDAAGSDSRYALFSLPHFKEVIGFHLLTLPIGLLLLLRFGGSVWRSSRGWRGGLAVTALATLLWSLVWHPGMGGADWDLFAWPALFVNLAGGIAWSQAAQNKKRRRRDDGAH